MKHLRRYIRSLLIESSYQTIRLHHSRGEERIDDQVNFGPYPQPSPSDQIGPSKPVGIWYDCDGQWEEFCRLDLGSYSNRGYDSVFEVFPNKSTVLFITNNQEFDDFEKTYGKPGKYELVIDWALVASHYDGIEICPYLHKKRMGHGWYYPWDVASGCIWSPSGATVKRKEC